MIAQRESPKSSAQAEQQRRRGGDPAAGGTMARIRAAGGGRELPQAMREELESRLQVPLRAVRVHDDAQAQALAAEVGARAFTYGVHIFLGKGERANDSALIAHEAAHVVQQQARAAGPDAPVEAGAAFEAESREAANAVSAGRNFRVQQRTAGARIQKIPIISDIVEWVEDQAWSLLDRFVPWLTPILRMGFFNWLKEKVAAAVSRAIDFLTAPVRAVRNVVASITTHFMNLVEWMREAASLIAQGDCSALSRAAERIEQAFTALVSPVIERLRAAWSAVSGFFSGLWSRFGAPVWEFLRNLGGAAWDRIKEFAEWIWDRTKPIRDRVARAWTWIKNQLGVGEGPEGQNGLLQWVQGKAGEIWREHILPFWERFKRPLMVVGGVLLMLSPAGPILAAGAAGIVVMRGVRWIKQYMRDREAVIQQRGVLRGVILPGIINGVQSVVGSLRRGAAAITATLAGVVGRINEAAGAIAGSILSFLARLLEWLAQLFGSFVEWAATKVVGFVEWVAGALNRLLAFLQPVFDFIGQLIDVIGNLLQIPMMVAGRVWNLVPACIRNPVVDFLVRQILGRLPIFREIVNTPRLWDRIQARVVTIVRNIFRDRNLLGALRNVFMLLLDILRVPHQLVATILQKAAAVWDALLERPIEFLKNILRAIREGFRLFFGNILRHLANGIASWLLGALEKGGITLPQSWTDWRGILNMLLEVMGISREHIFTLIERRLGRERTDMLRRNWERLAGAWEWLVLAVREGPAALWQRIVERLREIATALLSGAVSWLMDILIKRVSLWLLSFFDPTFITTVINVLIATYQVTMAIIEYTTRILEMINSVLDSTMDLIRGVLGAAASRIERALGQALPVAIALLAALVGIGNIPRRVREVILRVREVVDKALLWLIDKAIAAGQFVFRTAQTAAQAVVDWWRQRRAFRMGAESHTLQFRGEGASAQLVVRSTEMTMAQFLVQLRAKTPASDAAKQKQLGVIEAAAKTIDDIKTRTDGKFGQADGATIANAMTTIATTLTAMGEAALPPTVVKWTPVSIMGGTVGGEMLADSLTLNSGGYSGSAPYETNPLWLAVNRRSGVYVRGHLLNHHLFGPGKNENLVPITRKTNSDMSSQVEEKVKEKVLLEAKPVKYEVKADFSSKHTGRIHLPAEAELPKAVKMDAWDLSSSPPSHFIDKRIPHELPPDSPVGVEPELRRLSLSKPGSNWTEAKKALTELPSIGDTRAKLIWDYVTDNETRPAGSFRRFESWSDVARIIGVSEAVTLEWMGMEVDDPAHPGKKKRLVYYWGDTVWS